MTGLDMNGARLSSGIRQFTVRDAEHGTTFPAVVQYPTLEPSTGTTIGPYRFDATPDAPPASGTYPVCAISHGGGGSHLLYRSISTHLAANGFIVVCPEHPGDNRNDRSLSNTDVAAMRRPRQVSQALDAVLLDPFLGPVADTTRMCVIGHSMGGYTALALIGGAPWSRARQPIAVDADARIAAAVLLAPASDWFLAPDSLAHVSVPVHVMVGELDDVTPPARIQQALARLPANTPLTFDVVAGAGHYAFLTPFPTQMRRPDFPPSTDPAGFDRDAFHIELPRRILEFLNGVWTISRTRKVGST